MIPPTMVDRWEWRDTGSDMITLAGYDTSGKKVIQREFAHTLTLVRNAHDGWSTYQDPIGRESFIDMCEKVKQ